MIFFRGRGDTPQGTKVMAAETAASAMLPSDAGRPLAIAIAAPAGFGVNSRTPAGAANDLEVRVATGSWSTRAASSRGTYRPPALMPDGAFAPGAPGW
jgi:hypothetical protein